MNLHISKIRIDGGTQNRVHLNEETVSEYADALTDGVTLPPISVFFDGADYWLADGFHRYHAHRKIGALDIAAEARDGTRRDAILHSVGVNGAHGLRRTNADKRKAVETLLNDEEWSKWSERDIAKACQVSHTFVAKLKTVTGNVASDKKPTYINKHGQAAQMDVSRIGKSHQPANAEPQQAAKSGSVQPSMDAEIEAEIHDSFDPIAELEKANKEIESMAKIFEANDQLDAAVKEVKRLNELVRILEERNRGMMNECNEAKRLARSWKNRCEKLEREAKAAGLVDF